ncbi:MAG: hypothetical protein ACK5LN_09230 [Propioniciclava sp.]
MGVGLSTIEELTGALYAGRPEDFIRDRNAAIAAAKAAGDGATATALKALRRPTVAAWYVNVAARDALVSFHEWLALGRDLRAALPAGDLERVRALAAQRTPLENRVITDLRVHLETRGIVVKPTALADVRTTLRAALSSDEAADIVSGGRLTHTLTYAGFGDVTLPTPPPADAAAAEPAPAPGEQGSDAAGLAQEQARAAADTAVRQAAEDLERCEAATTECDRALADLDARIATLTDRLQTATASRIAQRNQRQRASQQLRAARQRWELATRNRERIRTE